MKIISADKRLIERRGAKALILGPTGVGKTSLLRTLDPATTLFVDIEAGDLAVQDLTIDTFHPRAWPECRDLAVYLAGANPAVPTGAVYSDAHLDAVIDQFDASPERLARYRTYFIDSITAAGRLCFAWAAQQPEAFSERSGKRDLRGAYGLHAREMCAWLLHLQQARSVNVVLLGILETVTDEFNQTEHRLQMEGAAPRASFQPSSIKSSPITGSISATVYRHAVSSAPHRILGTIRPRIVPAGSNNSSRHTWASSSTS